LTRVIANAIDGNKKDGIHATPSGTAMLGAGSKRVRAERSRIDARDESARTGV
jgi:hypothetical protein